MQIVVDISVFPLVTIQYSTRVYPRQSLFGGAAAQRIVFRNAQAGCCRRRWRSFRGRSVSGCRPGRTPGR
jgi:hypothetical protein